MGMYGKCGILSRVLVAVISKRTERERDRERARATDSMGIGKVMKQSG